MGSEPSDHRAVPRKRSLSINTVKRSSELAFAGAEGEINKRGNAFMAGDEETAVEEPVSPATRFFHHPNFNCHIVVELGTGKPIDVDAIKAGLAATLVRHPRFSSVLRKSRWLRTKVVVDDHIVLPELVAGDTDSDTDKLVEDYIASLSTSAFGLDPSRPLWDLHILNVPTSRAASVAVLRVHHSLGDGTSLMALLLACTRKASDPASPPSIPSSRRPTASVTPRNALLRVLVVVWAAIVVAWYTIVDMWLFAATMASLRDTKTPLTGVEGVEFHPKRFVHRTVSLDDLKAIKQAIGCTVNDVLIGITSAGLTKYLSRKFGENEGVKEKHLPKNLRVRSALLVNIRPTPGIQALVDMMEGDKCSAQWGNRFGYIMLSFPIVFHDDPLDYVRKGKAIADRKKKSLEAVLTYRCAELIVNLFGLKATASMLYRVMRNTTLSFSNIMGPVEEIAFYSHPIVYLAPSVYGHPQALTLHFQSYKNEMEIVLAVDDSTISDPHQLLDDLAESLKLIKDAVDLTRPSG